MDLGSLETIGKFSTEDQTPKGVANSSSDDSYRKYGGLDDTVKLTAKPQKKISSKESPRTSLNSLNKFKSQIKKPIHRNGSPLNWIPRQKGDTYLKRKIKQLQEASGMSSTLDETLGTANPHYCRLLREKIASREAAVKAVEARKASIVEASWCRILKAARIPSEEANALLSKAEKNAAEALEAATAKGVLMYDTIDCIETPSVKGKGFTHMVKASFVSAFEVDRQVAAAVKTALIRLAANCPSSSLNRDEYSGLLRKISENPEIDETDVTSDTSAGAGLELDLGSDDASSSSLGVNQMDEDMKFGMFGGRRFSQKYNKEGLVDIMLERIKCLKEEELASMATIVATCGLNAALAETENKHLDRRGSYAKFNSRRMSNFVQKHQPDVNLPSLDQCLVKHMTKLEREVQDARNAKKSNAKEGLDKPVKSNEPNVAEPGLESILVKRSSKLEREKAELKRKIGQMSEFEPREERPFGKGSQVKHMPRLEQEEVQEAKEGSSVSSQLAAECTEKENIDLSKAQHDLSKEESGLDSVLVKHRRKLEQEKMAEGYVQGHDDGTNYSLSRRKLRERELQEAWGGMSLGNCVKPHMSRLEREKAAWIKAEEAKKAAIHGGNEALA